MKIIDLLNKIANGEEVPKKIKYNIFELKRTMSNNLLRIYVDEEDMFFPEYYSGLTLNDEVEILEEEKKIPEKLDIEDDGYTIRLFGEKENEWTILDNVDVIICNKINSIIDYLKSKGK